MHYLEAALQAGGDVIGGIDRCQIDRDPTRHLGMFSTEVIIERTRALGCRGM